MPLNRHQKPSRAWKRCEQSGQVQMLSWQPDKDYPGAVVCLGCSYGVLIKKGSDHPATSQAGFEGTAGTVLAHDVRADGSEMRYRSGR